MALVKRVRDHLEYLENDDGSYKVLMLDLGRPSDDTKALKMAMNEYQWREGDFLLANYPKTGTHLLWEMMQMLLASSADYIKYSKCVLMMDITDLAESEAVFPSHRVINTHYRLDVLPPQFRNQRTVLVIRNPKDAVVSQYYFDMRLHSIRTTLLNTKVPYPSIDAYIDQFLNRHDDYREYGSYFTYYEYMWNFAKDNENILVVMFEDYLKKPKETVQRVDKFMGTNRDEKIIDGIVDALEFDKMSKVKEHPAADREFTAKHYNNNEESPSRSAILPLKIFRKGEVGDWKRHLTVAMNGKIDRYLSEWQLASEIPFVYE